MAARRICLKLKSYCSLLLKVIPLHALSNSEHKAKFFEWPRGEWTQFPSLPSLTLLSRLQPPSSSRKVPVHPGTSGPLRWLPSLPLSSPGLFLPHFQSLSSNVTFSGRPPAPEPSHLLSQHALPPTPHSILMHQAHCRSPEPPLKCSSPRQESLPILFIGVSHVLRTGPSTCV